MVVSGSMRDDIGLKETKRLSNIIVVIFKHRSTLKRPPIAALFSHYERRRNNVRKIYRPHKSHEGKTANAKYTDLSDNSTRDIGMQECPTTSAFYTWNPCRIDHVFAHVATIAQKVNKCSCGQGTRFGATRTTYICGGCILTEGV